MNEIDPARESIEDSGVETAPSHAAEASIEEDWSEELAQQPPEEQAEENVKKRAEKKSAGPPRSVTKAVADITPPIGRLPGEKLQKALARAGIGSRREMERWIDSGRIQAGWQDRPQLGDRVYPQQLIKVDGKPIDVSEGQHVRCLLYHKPVGEVCSRKDPEGRRTVFRLAASVEVWPMDCHWPP